METDHQHNYESEWLHTCVLISVFIKPKTSVHMLMLLVLVNVVLIV